MAIQHNQLTQRWVSLCHRATASKSSEIAALAMSGSSALLAINALMLKRTPLAAITRGGRIQGMPTGRFAEAVA